MGIDRLRHVYRRQLSTGIHLRWKPSNTLRALGYSGEWLGLEGPESIKRAVELNARADADRKARRTVIGNPLSPTCVTTLAAAWQVSREWGRFAEKTQETHAYWLKDIVSTWPKFEIETLNDPKLCKDWVNAYEDAGSHWNAFHAGTTLRFFLNWCKSENHITDAVAKFKITKPDDRKVLWEIPQIHAIVEYIETKQKFPSLAVGVLVSWDIAQNPGDVWPLKREHYGWFRDSETGGKYRGIDLTRSKTGETGVAIPLSPEIADRLDAYLAASPALPEAFLFRNETIGGEWQEQTRIKWFKRARRALKLPDELQMRDLRRTGITEGLSAGVPRAHVRAVSRHKSDKGLDPYNAIVELKDSRVVMGVQKKRAAYRKAGGTNGEK